MNVCASSKGRVQPALGPPHCTDTQTCHSSPLSFCQEQAAKHLHCCRKLALPSSTKSLHLSYRNLKTALSGAIWIIPCSGINQLEMGCVLPFCTLCFKDAIFTASNPLHPQLKGRCSTRYVKYKMKRNPTSISYTMCIHKKNLYQLYISIYTHVEHLYKKHLLILYNNKQKSVLLYYVDTLTFIYITATQCTWVSIFRSNKMYFRLTFSHA